MSLQWCENCKSDVLADNNDADGFSCCTQCGKVLDSFVVSSDPSFAKMADGSSAAVGSFVRSGEGGTSGGLRSYDGVAHQVTLQRGKDEIAGVVERLGVGPREAVVQAACRVHRLAVQRGFTRGRRVTTVAGACVYLACRQESRPVLLLDVADLLQTSVYRVGAAFMALCQLLRLEKHPLCTRPTDPSLFLHRFADRLQLGRRAPHVTDTALRLLASMKRDWLQTGRTPSGLCGAALYIAAHVHGFRRSKAHIVGVVHVGATTLSQRLVEFEATESGALTVEEFAAHAKQAESAHARFVEQVNQGVGEDPTGTLSCQHQGFEPPVAHFAHGMCRMCFVDYCQMSGGSHQAGRAPPSFLKGQQRAAALALAAAEGSQAALPAAAAPSTAALPAATSQKGVSAEASSKKAGGEEEEEVEEVEDETEASKRLKEQDPVHRLELEHEVDLALRSTELREYIPEAARLPLSLPPPPQPHISKPQRDTQRFIESQVGATSEAAQTSGRELIASQLGVLPIKPPPPKEALKSGGECEEPETFSDISDNEVESYLHTEEEAQLKEVIWTAMNKDFIETQEAKAAMEESAAEAARAAGRDPEEEKKKEAERKAKRKRKKEAAISPDNPAESAVAATKKMVSAKKMLSSKINYDALTNLFENDNEDVTKDIGSKAAAIRNKTMSAVSKKGRKPKNPNSMAATRPQRGFGLINAKTEDTATQKGTVGVTSGGLGGEPEKRGFALIGGGKKSLGSLESLGSGGLAGLGGLGGLGVWSGSGSGGGLGSKSVVFGSAAKPKIYK